MKTIDERFEEIRIVPVVKLEKAEDAKDLAGALVRGGIPCAEVTFRTDAAAEAIRRMSESYPDMLVGAGTVLETEQVDAAIEAGAKFIVSPGLNPKIVRYCQEKGIPVYPGVATASEIEQALELGLSVVKFFPGRSKRRRQSNQSTVGTLFPAPVYADRRYQPGEYWKLPLLPAGHCMRRQLDGKRKSDCREKV